MNKEWMVILLANSVAGFEVAVDSRVGEAKGIGPSNIVHLQEMELIGPKQDGLGFQTPSALDRL